MMHLIIIVDGLFALTLSVIIDAIRIVNSLERRGEEFPTDKLELHKLWGRYFNDEL